MGIGKYVPSDTFMVGGYSWVIYFYPDGKSPEDNSVYVSLFIALASEGADVRALFELTFVDQSGNERHKVHSHFGGTLESGPYTLKYKGSMWGYKRFFKRSLLESSDYLKDNCLLVRCCVGVVKSRTEGPRSYNIPVPFSSSPRTVFKMGKLGSQNRLFWLKDCPISFPWSIDFTMKSASFKEESDVLSYLKESERKALSDLKSKLEEAIVKNTLFKKKKESIHVKAEKKKGEDKTVDKDIESWRVPLLPSKEDETVDKDIEEDTVDKDIELWGVPLLPSKGAEGTDVILLKFLRARDFKVNETFEMLENTLKWRKENKIDSILGEDFGEELEHASYMNGVDRESRPVCYNILSEFKNEELNQTTIGSEKFLRWRFQLMKKGIQKLNLKPGGVTTFLQVHDLKSAPVLSSWTADNQAVVALQDNYPEFVSRNIFINVPFWFYAVRSVIAPFLTQRTKSKFVVARPANVTETLLKYIPAEEIPVQYGGFKKRN